MNSFNHYAYGAIGDWLYQGLRKNQLLDQVQSIMDWKETDIFHSFKWSTLNFPQANDIITSTQVKTGVWYKRYITVNSLR